MNTLQLDGNNFFDGKLNLNFLDFFEKKPKKKRNRISFTTDKINGITGIFITKTKNN